MLVLTHLQLFIHLINMYEYPLCLMISDYGKYSGEPDIKKNLSLQLLVSQ